MLDKYMFKFCLQVLYSDNRTVLFFFFNVSKIIYIIDMVTIFVECILDLNETRWEKTAQNQTLTKYLIITVIF